MHPADLTKMLQGLVGEGILGKNGRGRATYYTLSDKQDALPLLSGFLDRNSTQEAVDSTHSVADSPHNEGDSPHNEGDSTHKERECMPGSSALGSEELDELNAIAEVARRKRRLPREHMRRLIVALCQVRFLTAAELATLVGRSARNLRERFLKPMVDEELLIRKYPDKPNRPDQAYGIPKA